MFFLLSGNRLTDFSQKNYRFLNPVYRNFWIRYVSVLHVSDKNFTFGKVIFVCQQNTRKKNTFGTISGLFPFLAKPRCHFFCRVSPESRTRQTSDTPNKGETGRLVITLPFLSSSEFCFILCSNHLEVTQ